MTTHVSDNFPYQPTSRDASSGSVFGQRTGSHCPPGGISQDRNSRLGQDRNSRRRPPILADVARRARVSLKTASRALNGEPHVSGPTRERVRRAAQELEYKPNPAAIALAKARGRGGSEIITGSCCQQCGAYVLTPAASA